MVGRQWFAIAAIGRDRPGIVAELSELVYASGCNLEDASMTMLGNEFATLMLVSGVGEQLAADLSDRARKLEWERHLTIFVRPVERPTGESAALAGGRQLALTAQGVDKAGIVAGVARCLADRGILINDLRGRIAPMPQSGTPLYTLTLRMSAPPELDLDNLRSTLATVGERLSVEITVREES